MLWLERPMMAFEKANGYYSSTAYFIAKVPRSALALLLSIVDDEGDDVDQHTSPLQPMCYLA